MLECSTTEAHQVSTNRVRPSFRERAASTTNPSDLLKILRQELGNMLLERIKTLSGEALRLHSDMEAVISRLRWRGEDAALTDIKTANWHKTKTEIQTLQQVRELIAVLLRESPGVVEGDVQQLTDDDEA